MKNILIIFLALVLLCSCGPVTSKSDGEYVNLFAMDTFMEITAYGDGAKEALKEAEELLYDLDRKWSVNNQSGEIFALNHRKSVDADEKTIELVEASIEIGRKTGGAFDVFIYPFVKLWGFTTGEYMVPDPADIERAAGIRAQSAIEIENGRITLLGDEAEIDLGAIAKGYAADKVKELLVQQEVESAIISLGGNVYAHGCNPDGAAWNVAVQNPAGGGSFIGYMKLSDAAAVTSGSYERFFEQDGVKYHHIMDPETGYPVDSGLLSVTIIDESATMADALSTAIFVMGVEKGTDYWRDSGKGFGAIFVTEENEIYITENLMDVFVPADKSQAVNILE